MLVLLSLVLLFISHHFDSISLLFVYLLLFILTDASMLTDNILCSKNKTYFRNIYIKMIFNFFHQIIWIRMHALLNINFHVFEHWIWSVQSKPWVQINSQYHIDLLILTINYYITYLMNNFCSRIFQRIFSLFYCKFLLFITYSLFGI